jgi:hypothetical protein
MLRTCPNVTHVELHLGDIPQSPLRELGHLLIEFLERQPTLTRAIKYQGKSMMSGTTGNGGWTLVGRGGKLPNGKTMDDYVSSPRSYESHPHEEY